MSRTEAPNRIEVPVERVEVKITIDDLLAALAEQARTLAEGAAVAETGTRGVEQPGSGVAKRLSSLSELALALKGEVDQIRRLDPDLADQLQQGKPRR